MTVRDLAKECYETANGDITRAVDLLVASVKADRQMFREMMEPLVRQAASSLINEMIRTDRKEVWRPKRAAVEALAAGTVRSLMEFPLPGGKPLKDASKSEVERAAEFYQAQAEDMQAKGRWLALVATMVPPNHTVGRALSEATLLSLRQQAKSGGLYPREAQNAAAT